MPINIDIRSVVPDDLDALTRLLVENNRPEVTATFHPFALDEETARRLCLPERQDEYFIARETASGSMVALGMLRGWEEGYETPSFGVFVDYRFQGQGVGRRVTEFALDRARGRGCREVRLSVYASNLPAVCLYRSMGFVDRSSESVMRNSVEDDKIVMVCSLAADGVGV